MRFRLFCTTVCFSLIFFAGMNRSSAQAPASQSTPNAANIPHIITLDNAIKAAITRNYTTRMASNTVRRDEFSARAARDNMWLPSVQATGNWNYNYSFNPTAEEVEENPFIPIVVNGDTTGFAPNPNPTYTQVAAQSGTQELNYNVGASINLFNGFADVASINQAEATLGSAQNTSTWTRQMIADNVVKAYLTILLNQELVYAADSTLAEAQAQFSLVQGQYQAGVVAIAQVYTQQSVVAADSLALIQADVNFQNSKVSLLFLMNVSPDQFNNYSFNDDGIDTATTPAARAAVDTSIQPDAINAAIDKRPDILAQEESIKASEDVIDVTRGGPNGFYPTLNATLGIGGSGGGTSLTGVQFENGINAGLQLTIPIFDKFQTTLSVDEEEVDVENARIALEQDVQQVRNSVVMDVNNLKATEKSLDASESAFRAALESFRLADEQLRVGAGTEVEVVIAEAALETARTNRVNAKYNWVLAQKQVAYDLGKWNY
jgi:outer membrane protein